MDRRDLLTGGAAAAAALPFIATVNLGKHLDIPIAPGKGLSFPVTDGFYKRFLAPNPDLTGMSHGDLGKLQKELLDRSTARANRTLPRPSEPMAQGGTLTVAEQHRLDVITHVMNCHGAAAELQGRPLSDFGFVGIDQVHGEMKPVTRIGECGCHLCYIFDHAVVQAKLWGADLAGSEAALAKLRRMTFYIVADAERVPTTEREKPVPPRAIKMMERLRERHREGFLHYAGIGGVAHLPPEVVAKMEVPLIPHFARYACDEHLHLWHHPAAHDAAVQADNAGVADAIEHAYRLAAEDRRAEEEAKKLLG